MVKKSPVIKINFDQKNHSLMKVCANCSACREVCPSYQIFQSESFFAGGRIRILRSFLEQSLVSSDDFLKSIYTCTSCKACESVCPVSLPFVKLSETIREQLVNQHIGPMANQTKFIPNLLQHRNPYGEDEKKKILQGIDPNLTTSVGPYAYFIGCTTRLRAQDLAIQALTLFAQGTHEKIVVLGSEEWCCGSPYLRTGLVNIGKDHQEMNMKDFIQHNIDVLQARGVKTLFFTCAGCYKTVKEDWPKYTKVPFECLHITEFIATKISDGTFHLNSISKTVAYHDPCHLGRFQQIYDAPRTILQSIPNIKYLELSESKENALCCGAGGGVKAGFPDFAIQIAKKRLDDAIELGVEVLVTSCVFCRQNFLDAIKKFNLSIQINNIEELVFQLLRQ